MLSRDHTKWKDVHQGQDRSQEALCLAVRQLEDEPEHQSGLDRVIGELPLPAATAGSGRLPVLNRVVGDPQGDLASLHERPVVFEPIVDSIFRLVLGMDSGVHADKV
jgi:hypothetical protein